MNAAQTEPPVTEQTIVEPPIVEVKRADYTGAVPTNGNGRDTEARSRGGSERQAPDEGKRAGGDGKPTAPEQQPGDHHRPHANPGEEIPKDLPKPSTGVVILVALLFVGALIGIFVLGWLPHRSEEKQTASDAAANTSGKPAVAVDHPKTQVLSKDVVLPCDVRANQQTAIFGRANGYLKQWLVDVGGHVKQGQLIAVIDTPDVDAQLREDQAVVESAKATVVKSEADVEVAKTDYERYLKSQKETPGSVTEEDVDTKRAAYADAAGALKVAAATVAQDEAEVSRLTVLQGFEQVIAPFSGTITARNYDVGALINPSVTTAGTEIFDIADTATLRVFVNVPQTYSTVVKMGQPAYLTVSNYPKREFAGVVARMSGALDQNTRTLPFEVDFVNSDGALFAGMYGQARLPIADAQPVLIIPTSALIFDKNGLQVALVKDDKVHFQPITVGRDLGTDIEVTNGLTLDDEVVTNPGERLAEGVEVDATNSSTSVAAGK